VIAHGAKALSRSAIGSRTSSLLRRLPTAILAMIGSSRSGRQAGHVARGDGGVVDDHARRLGARLAGGHADIVEAGGGQLGDAGDVVEQGYKSGRHGILKGTGGVKVASAKCIGRRSCAPLPSASTRT
jgi:hypothetical protein